MGSKDINRQQPNVKAMKEKKMELKLFRFLPEAKHLWMLFKCMRYWVANCDTTAMCVGSTVGPNIFVKICGWSTSQISKN